MRRKKKFFWSDPHLFHKNILTFKDDAGNLIRGSRFKTIRDMNETLLENWNACCKDGDKGYWLGDTMVGVREQGEATEFMRKFSGNLAMFLGNHDHVHQPAYRRFRYIDLWSGGKFKPLNFVACHIPLRQDQMRDGGFNVHGHTHQNLVTQPVYNSKHDDYDYSPDPHYINVCVEQTDYKPVELDEIVAIIESRS